MEPCSATDGVNDTLVAVSDPWRGAQRARSGDKAEHVAMAATTASSVHVASTGVRDVSAHGGGVSSTSGTSAFVSGRSRASASVASMDSGVEPHDVAVHHPREYPSPGCATPNGDVEDHIPLAVVAQHHQQHYKHHQKHNISHIYQLKTQQNDQHQWNDNGGSKEHVSHDGHDHDRDRVHDHDNNDDNYFPYMSTVNSLGQVVAAHERQRALDGTNTRRRPSNVAGGSGSGTMRNLRRRLAELAAVSRRRGTTDIMRSTSSSSSSSARSRSSAGSSTRAGGSSGVGRIVVDDNDHRRAFGLSRSGAGPRLGFGSNRRSGTGGSGSTRLRVLTSSLSRGIVPGRRRKRKSRLPPLPYVFVNQPALGLVHNAPDAQQNQQQQLFEQQKHQQQQFEQQVQQDGADTRWFTQAATATSTPIACANAYSATFDATATPLEYVATPVLDTVGSTPSASAFQADVLAHPNSQFFDQRQLLYEQQQQNYLLQQQHYDEASFAQYQQDQLVQEQQQQQQQQTYISQHMTERQVPADTNTQYVEQTLSQEVDHATFEPAPHAVRKHASSDSQIRLRRSHVLSFPRNVEEYDRAIAHYQQSESRSGDRSIARPSPLNVSVRGPNRPIKASQLIGTEHESLINTSIVNVEQRGSTPNGDIDPNDVVRVGDTSLHELLYYKFKDPKDLAAIFSRQYPKAQDLVPQDPQPEAPWSNKVGTNTYTSRLNKGLTCTVLPRTSSITHSKQGKSMRLAEPFPLNSPDTIRPQPTNVDTYIIGDSPKEESDKDKSPEVTTKPFTAVPYVREDLKNSFLIVPARSDTLPQSERNIAVAFGPSNVDNAALKKTMMGTSTVFNESTIAYNAISTGKQDPSPYPLPKPLMPPASASSLEASPLPLYRSTAVSTSISMGDGEYIDATGSPARFTQGRSLELPQSPKERQQLAQNSPEGYNSSPGYSSNLVIPDLQYSPPKPISPVDTATTTALGTTEMAAAATALVGGITQRHKSERVSFKNELVDPSFEEPTVPQMYAEDFDHDAYEDYMGPSREQAKRPLEADTLPTVPRFIPMQQQQPFYQPLVASNLVQQIIRLISGKQDERLRAQERNLAREERRAEKAARRGSAKVIIPSELTRDSKRRHTTCSYVSPTEPKKPLPLQAIERQQLPTVGGAPFFPQQSRYALGSQLVAGGDTRNYEEVVDGTEEEEAELNTKPKYGLETPTLSPTKDKDNNAVDVDKELVSIPQVEEKDEQKQKTGSGDMIISPVVDKKPLSVPTKRRDSIKPTLDTRNIADLDNSKGQLDGIFLKTHEVLRLISAIAHVADNFGIKPTTGDYYRMWSLHSTVSIFVTTTAYYAYSSGASDVAAVEHYRSFKRYRAFLDSCISAIIDYSKCYLGEIKGKSNDYCPHRMSINTTAGNGRECIVCDERFDFLREQVRNIVRILQIVKNVLSTKNDYKDGLSTILALILLEKRKSMGSATSTEGKTSFSNYFPWKLMSSLFLTFDHSNKTNSKNVAIATKFGSDIIRSVKDSAPLKRGEDALDAVLRFSKADAINDDIRKVRKYAPMLKFYQIGVDLNEELHNLSSKSKLAENITAVPEANSLEYLKWVSTRILDPIAFLCLKLSVLNCMKITCNIRTQRSITVQSKLTLQKMKATLKVITKLSQLKNRKYVPVILGNQAQFVIGVIDAMLALANNRGNGTKASALKLFKDRKLSQENGACENAEDRTKDSIFTDTQSVANFGSNSSQDDVTATTDYQDSFADTLLASGIDVLERMIADKDKDASDLCEMTTNAIRALGIVDSILDKAAVGVELISLAKEFLKNVEFLAFQMARSRKASSNGTSSIRCLVAAADAINALAQLLTTLHRVSVALPSTKISEKLVASAAIRLWLGRHYLAERCRIPAINANDSFAEMKRGIKRLPPTPVKARGRLDKALRVLYVGLRLAVDGPAAPELEIGLGGRSSASRFLVTLLVSHFLGRAVVLKALDDFSVRLPGNAASRQTQVSRVRSVLRSHSTAQQPVKDDIANLFATSEDGMTLANALPVRVINEPIEAESTATSVEAALNAGRPDSCRWFIGAVRVLDGSSVLARVKTRLRGVPEVLRAGARVPVPPPRHASLRDVNARSPSRRSPKLEQPIEPQSSEDGGAARALWASALPSDAQSWVGIEIGVHGVCTRLQRRSTGTPDSSARLDVVVRIASNFHTGIAALVGVDVSAPAASPTFPASLVVPTLRIRAEAAAEAMLRVAARHC